MTTHFAAGLNNCKQLRRVHAHFGGSPHTSARSFRLARTRCTTRAMFTVRRGPGGMWEARVVSKVSVARILRDGPMRSFLEKIDLREAESMPMENVTFPHVHSPKSKMVEAKSSKMKAVRKTVVR